MGIASAGDGVRVRGVTLGHIGVIPDGTRRYASRQRIDLEEAYLLSAGRALEAIAWCRDAGIAHVSAFGVSQENIARRSRGDLRALHAAVVDVCERVARLPDTGLHLFGDAAALSMDVPGRDELIRLQRNADPAGSFVVHVGVNYSGRAELAAVLRATRQRGLELIDGAPERVLLSANVPAVDLMVRTGGQQRLSGFLPLQTAYAELWFTDTLWPDLTHDEFRSALAWYARQERHFGE
jgi:short-chain Z-isoprenyl diphosphate synthase